MAFQWPTGSEPPVPAQKLALVTGGATFLGAHLVDRLLSDPSEAWHVRIFDAAPRADPPKGSLLAECLADGRAEYIQGDIRSSMDVVSACRGVYCVFHTISPHASASGPKDVQVAAVAGTKNVLEACSVCAVAKLIYTSSAAVAFGGEAPLVKATEERTPYPEVPLSPEAGAQQAVEELIIKADGKGGMRTIVLRIANCIGAGEDQFLPRLVRSARAGRTKWIPGDGSNLADFTHVSDAVEAHVAAEGACIPGPRNKLRQSGLKAEDDPGGKVYFITGGDPRPYWTVCGDALEQLGYPRPHKPLALSMLLPIATAYSALCQRAPFLFREVEEMSPARIRGTSMHVTFDTARAARLLKYKPTADLDEGLKDAVAAAPELREENTPAPAAEEASGAAGEVRAALGGGTTADLLLWSRPVKSAAALLGALILLSHLAVASMITIGAKMLLAAVIVSVIAARAQPFIHKYKHLSRWESPVSILHIPQVTEEGVTKALRVGVGAANQVRAARRSLARCGIVARRGSRQGLRACCQVVRGAVGRGLGHGRPDRGPRADVRAPLGLHIPPRVPRLQGRHRRRG
mmetsp:Transcript_71416/g.225537  ORF Transcript_71416/g.225537 Transcript_71416/m.225537 type:complete len:576 (-) Transcript_71416:109-1836(-)